MNSNTNLAFTMDTSYNYKGNLMHSNKVLIPSFGNKQFLIQTKRALILRENILASGMEIEDAKKAHEISKHVTRR